MAGHSEADNALLFVLFLNDTLYGVVQRIAEQGIKIHGIHECQLFSLGDAGQLDLVLLAVQQLFHQQKIQHLVAGFCAALVKNRRLFDLPDVGVPLGTFTHSSQRADLVLQIVALAVDELNVLSRHLLLLLLRVQQLFHDLVFLLEPRFIEHAEQHQHAKEIAQDV